MSSSPPAPLQILIIEDNETDAFLATRELQRAGFRVAPTRVDNETDLRAALTRQVWDLILCDFTLPGFSGSEALRISRELVADVPFIFVSGTIGEAAIVEAMRSGAQDYVMKDRLTRLAPAVARELSDAAMRREAKLNERWMRESEHKYRQLFDALTEAVFLIDETTGRIIDTNRQAEQLLDRARGKIVGQNHTRLFESPSGSVVLTELRASAANPKCRGCELHLVKPDASPILVHASASHIELYNRSFLLVLIHPEDDDTPGGQLQQERPQRLTPERIVEEVACWPQEAIADLIGRLSFLRTDELSPSAQEN